MTEKPHRELITDVQRSALKTRMDYYEQLAMRKQITDSLHRELAVRVLQYADVLRVYQPTAIPDDIVRVRSRLGQSAPVAREAPGDTSQTQTQMRPAVLSIDAAELVGLLDRLDEVAAELGFAADTDQIGEPTA